MKPIFSLAALAVVFAAAASVRADLIVPHKPGDSVPLVIVVDEKAAPAKLEVPKELVATMKAALDGGPGDGLAAAMPTVAAGLSLSLALAFGGVWLVRHRTSPAVKNFAILLGAAALLAVSGLTVLADKAPGKRPPLAPGDAVVVTVIDRAGAPVTLTVSKDKLAKALEKAGK